MAMLEIRGVHKSFHTYAKPGVHPGIFGRAPKPTSSLDVLRGVDLTVEKGDVVAILGPSGSGKTTLLRCIAGLERPDSGQITDLPERIGYVFQEDRLCDGFSAVDNIRLVTGRAMDEGEICRHLKELGLADSLGQPVRELSGGMRQRVMIAMALACEPDILIADEPTTALDVTIQAQILELMQSLQKKLGMAIIMVTHDLGVIADMCDEIIVMYGGRVCERGTAEDIFYRPHHEYTKGLLRSIPNVDRIGEKLIPIPGTPINLLNMPKGCAFCSRCPYAMNICAEYSPETIELKGGHQVACWLTDPRADVSGVPFHTGGEQDEQ